MQQITLNVEEKYAGIFLAFLKTIHYVKIVDAQLSPEQETELAVAIEESYNPENWVAHEDVMERVEKRLNK
jgi:chaperone required for assembly of F1-ATPase